MLARGMVPVSAVYFCYGGRSGSIYLDTIVLSHSYRINRKSSALLSAGVFRVGLLGNTLGGVVSDGL